ILLPLAVERDLVAWFDIKQIFEDLAVAADMASQHHIAALAGIGRPTVLPDRVLRDLPDGDLLPALLLDIPANLDYFRVDADAGDGHACDGWRFRRLGAIGHRADHLAFGFAPDSGVEHRRGEGGWLFLSGRGDGDRGGYIGIAARGVAIIIGL